MRIPELQTYRYIATPIPLQSIQVAKGSVKQKMCLLRKYFRASRMPLLGRAVRDLPLYGGHHRAQLKNLRRLLALKRGHIYA